MDNVVDVDYGNQTRSSGESLTSAREEEKKHYNDEVQTIDSDYIEDQEKGDNHRPEQRKRKRVDSLVDVDEMIQDTEEGNNLEEEEEVSLD